MRLFSLSIARKFRQSPLARREALLENLGAKPHARPHTWTFTSKQPFQSIVRIVDSELNWHFYYAIARMPKEGEPFRFYRNSKYLARNIPDSIANTITFEALQKELLTDIQSMEEIIAVREDLSEP